MRARWLASFIRGLLVPPRREPDFIIGDRYMLRWWVIPRNRYFNIYLHHLLCSDDDRALHDHPWWSVSLCLSGRFKEHRARESSRWIGCGHIVVRSAEAAHRLELLLGEDAWTLFITGPRVREWGFHCPQGWRHWREFTRSGDSGQIGRGCGED